MMLRLLRFYMPRCIKKRELQNLANVTADAFGVPAPILNTMSLEKALEEYAKFTNLCAKACKQKSLVEQKLYQNAYAWGTRLRHLLRIRTWRETVEALTLLYSCLDIEFVVDEARFFSIRKCFFSTFYSEDVCLLISALDQGFVAGLSVGDELIFEQRITAGSLCCSGCIKKGERLSL